MESERGATNALRKNEIRRPKRHGSRMRGGGQVSHLVRYDCTRSTSATRQTNENEDTHSNNSRIPTEDFFLVLKCGALPDSLKKTSIFVVHQWRFSSIVNYWR